MILNSIFSKIIKIYKNSSKNDSGTDNPQTPQTLSDIGTSASSQAIRNNFIGQNKVNLETVLDKDEKEKRLNCIKELNALRENAGAEIFDNDTIQKLIKLPQEQFEMAKRLCFINERQNQLYTWEVEELIQYPKDKFPKIQELAYIEGRKKQQFGSKDIKWLLSLDEKYFEKAKNLFLTEVIGYSSNKEFLDGHKISELASKEDKDYQKVESLLHVEGRGDNQFSIGEIDELLELNDKDFEKAKDLFYIKERDEYRQLSSDAISYMVMYLDDAQFKIAKNLLYIEERGENQFYGNDIAILARLDDEKLKKAKELFYIKGRKDKQYSGEEIAEYALLPKEQIDKIKNIPPEYTMTPKEIIRLSKLDTSDFKMVFKILESRDRLLDADKTISLFEDISKKSFKNRKEIYDALKTTVFLNKNCELQWFLDNKLREYQQSLGQITTPISVSEEDNNEFWNNFLVTANKNNIETIKNLSPIIEKYAQDGLPVEYSRNEFIKDLNTKLSKFPQSQQEKILQKLDINLDKENYEGFINLYNLDKNNPEENEIQELCEKFLLRNKINTGDKNADKFLNGIIKGVPEFINVIGKKQHSTHKYTLDLHTLRVMQEFVSNPKFETLSNKDKMVAQLMILFHDTGKKGNVIDSGHEFASAIITNDIIQKFNIPEPTKRRIVELIKNHNWLQLVGENQKDIKTISLMFRNPKDFAIAEIFAEADLKGVGRNFYQIYGGLIEPSIEKIKENLNEFYSTGNMLFTTKILNQNKLPQVEYKGNMYKVLDVVNMSEDEDLSKFGLSAKNKRDLRLLYHRGDLDTLEKLLKPFNESMLSMSLISPYKKITYGYEEDKVGVMLDVSNSNIGISYPEDFHSGWEKDFKDFVEMSSSEGNFSKLRKFQSEKIKEALSQKYNIKKIDYAEIYKAVMDKQFLEQVGDIKLSNGIKIKGKDLHEAYKYSEYELLMNGHMKINEITAYNPQIKGFIFMGESMDEIPDKALEFVRKHDLPIFIMGNRF